MYFYSLFFIVGNIIFFNLLRNFTGECALNLLICFVIILLPSLLCALIIRILPQKWFTPENKFFRVGEKERKFLVGLGIKKWKGKIPDLGNFVNFKKRKLIDANNPNYINKFLIETCYAETTHFLCAVTAFIFMFFTPRNYFWNISFPVGIIYAMYNIPPILIQRFNRPRLKVQLKRLTRIQNSDNILQV